MSAVLDHTSRGILGDASTRRVDQTIQISQDILPRLLSAYLFCKPGYHSHVCSPFSHHTFDSWTNIMSLFLASRKALCYATNHQFRSFSSTLSVRVAAEVKKLGVIGAGQMVRLQHIRRYLN